MEKEMENEMEYPQWVLPRGHINEEEFCRQFYIKHAIVYQDGAFFSPEGRLQEETVRYQIYLEMRDFVRTNVAARVERCLNTLRYVAAQSCLKDRLMDQLFTIHAANGEYRLHTREFSPRKELTRFRLPVNYNPEAKAPERWLKFLGELLHEEDIPTLQEFMGYCLIPCTLGQKMLIITGKGGEGKSRIGVVMKSLLGWNMNLGSVAKVEKSPFARADLQHLLLMVDDDLKMEALDQTNYIKSIITAELPMDLEKKGEQSYQGQLYARFMAFGNSNLQALHDRSYGFFRRQIILEARERPKDRVDDPFLGVALKEEAEGILLWCIEGLERLFLNDFRFTQSRRARENLLRSMAQANNIPEFLKSKGYIRLEPEGMTSSKLLYSVYRSWCEDNAYHPLRSSTFWSFLSQNLETYQLRATRSVPIGNGKYARGYEGISVCTRF